MGKYISSSEFWDKVMQRYDLPNAKRGIIDVVFEEDFGKVTFKHFNTGLGIKYTYMNNEFVEDTVVENTNSYDGSFICFNTGNDMYMQDAISDQKVLWNSNSCWNGEMCEGHKAKSIICKGCPHEFHHIGFDNNIFKDLTKDNKKYDTAKRVYKGEYIDVKFNNHITQEQKNILEDLKNTSFKDTKLQELYIESKLLDLAYISINSIKDEESANNIHLSKQDIESLIKAKKILLENMVNPPSLKDLAYKSAINEFKLKKGFKQIFGNTVFGYLQEYRLNEAKKLLKTNELNIGEVASMVGYKSISHFSKIFKEHFKIAPIEIKKGSKRNI